MNLIRQLLFGVGILFTVNATETLAANNRAQIAEQRVLPSLQPALQAMKLKPGAQVFIRIFKHERVLELWLKQADLFVLFRSYPICAYSGSLGPKLREGDGQAPEGVYLVKPRQMNPASQFHLSFNLGYPNAFDQAHGRTGSALMVHGNCVSIGCYAMTDEKIEEIYTLMALAFKAGQDSVQVHALPFRFTPENWEKLGDSPNGTQNSAFWRDLELIDQAFERTQHPPLVRVRARRYRLD